MCNLSRVWQRSDCASTRSRTRPAFRSIPTYDWVRHQWTVPINLQVARIFKFGTQPVQLGVGGKYYAVSPAGGPEWGARLNVVFLFPTKG